VDQWLFGRRDRRPGRSMTQRSNAAPHRSTIRTSWTSSSIPIAIATASCRAIQPIPRSRRDWQRSPTFRFRPLFYSAPMTASILHRWRTKMLSLQGSLSPTHPCRRWLQCSAGGTPKICRRSPRFAPGVSAPGFVPRLLQFCPDGVPDNGQLKCRLAADEIQPPIIRKTRLGSRRLDALCGSRLSG
jgi:hypothetical protein